MAVECLFCWYWLADLCAEEGLTLVLGRAVYSMLRRHQPFNLKKVATV